MPDNLRVGDQVYNGKHGTGIIKELYVSTVDTRHFSMEKRVTVLFHANSERVDMKVDEIEKMQ